MLRLVLLLFLSGFSVGFAAQKPPVSKPSDLNPKVLNLALEAYHHAEGKGLVKRPVLTIIDYSKNSNQKRLWVFDLAHHTMPFHTYVAHGRNTGQLHAVHFSNQPGSKESSIGTFVTGHTYVGHKGYSLRLIGLEKGFNSNAYRRAVVVHGASYANPAFLKHFGYLGRSWGCPAVPTGSSRAIINTIKEGSVVFSYYPDQHYLKTSDYI